MPRFKRHPNSTKITLSDLERGSQIEVYEEDLRAFIRERDKEIQIRQTLRSVVTEYFGTWNEDRVSAIVDDMYDDLTATRNIATANAATAHPPTAKEQEQWLKQSVGKPKANDQKA